MRTPSCRLFALLLSLLCVHLIDAPAHAELTPPAAGMVLVAQDDCGTKAAPHLTSGASWTLTEEERKGLTISDDRYLHFAHHENVVGFRFVGLRPDAKYVVRVHYFNVVQDRTVRLVAGDSELHGPIELPKGKAVVREATLPPGAYRDSSIRISCLKAGGTSALVSALELWSDKPGLLGPAGCFVRFRVDETPGGKPLSVTAIMKVHYSPWNTAAFPLTPKEGSAAGVTPWMNLAKLPGAANGSLMLSIPDGARGVTQFSMVGEGDVVAREINWGEPDGRKIIVEPSASDIRTFREQERRYYLNTLRLSGDRVLPLTRPPLMFSNAWGHTTGAAAEYMVKTFRLMGFNSVETSADAAAYEKYYGWNSQGGQYSPPAYMPFDEEKSRGLYEDFYKKFFEKGGKGFGASEGMRIFQLSDEPGEAAIKDSPEARAGFHQWLTARGVEPALFGKKAWDEVGFGGKAATPEEKRLLYWTRLYQAYLTPKMFGLAAQAVRDESPGKQVTSYVALSGHSMNFGNRQPLDMFQLAQYPNLMPGISDWMTSGTWWWDGHESVAFSVAMFNGGARRYGKDFDKPPISFPMMHCVSPSLLRSTIQLANNCKLISYYNYGPDYEATEGFWSNTSWMPSVVGHLNNRAAQVDDILSPGSMRRVRVAMLWSASQDVWSPQPSFTDKRATFLALSHEYFRPELVTEQQVRDGALEHYDALYVLDASVARDVQGRIEEWVKGGRLLWACADAAFADEYAERWDLLDRLVGLKREYSAPLAATQVSAIEGESKFDAYGIPVKGKAGEVMRPVTFTWEGARVRAEYAEKSPAWGQKAAGKGTVVYVGHRAGASYSARSGKRGPFANWPTAGREMLVSPLLEAKVSREMWLSVPLVAASPISTDAGTVVVVYDLNPTPSNDVVLSLREPVKPVSVQTFDDRGALVDLPFEFADGVVRISIKQITWNGMMVTVRRKPAPPDDRLATMRAAAEAGLASEDWRGASAAAWFAGFFPDWKLSARLVPLLKHSHWAVRRSAAESLGRLRAADAAAALRGALEVETDTHALADELFALALLRDGEATKLCEKYRQSADPFVRQEAARALAALNAK